MGDVVSLICPSLLNKQSTVLESKPHAFVACYRMLIKRTANLNEPPYSMFTRLLVWTTHLFHRTCIPKHHVTEVGWHWWTKATLMTLEYPEKWTDGWNCSAVRHLDWDNPPCALCTLVMEGFQQSSIKPTYRNISYRIIKSNTEDWGQSGFGTNRACWRIWTGEVLNSLGSSARQVSPRSAFRLSCDSTRSIWSGGTLSLVVNELRVSPSGSPWSHHSPHPGCLHSTGRSWVSLLDLVCGMEF